MRYRQAPPWLALAQRQSPPGMIRRLPAADIGTSLTFIAAHLSVPVPVQHGGA